MVSDVAPAPVLQRSTGAVRVSFRRRGEATVLDALYQAGCGKVRFPRAAERRPPEAVLINTAGGLTDGDLLTNRLHWQPRASAIATTQAAERIYRSRGDDAVIDTSLQVDDGAVAVWLPQETIIFDGARLARSTEINVTGGGSLLAAESIVFGRTAMGERVLAGSVFDSWRLRIDGRLAFADGFAVDDRQYGSLQLALDRPAVGDGAHAFATLLLVTDDAGRYLQPLRDALQRCEVTGGVSQPGAHLVLRALAGDAQRLRDTMIQVFNAIQSLQDGANAFRNFSLPRVYNC